jgi:hypothetical protein
MQNVAMRERMFTMRLSEEESTRLDHVAAHYGLNGAGLLRMLLKREEDTIERAKQWAPTSEPPKARGARTNRPLGGK